MRRRQAHQSGTYFGNGRLLVGQADFQIAFQHMQRRFVVQSQHHIVVSAGDGVHLGHRQAALRDARHHGHLGIKGHTAQATMEHAGGFALARHVAITTLRKLHHVCSAGRQATKHITTGGALGQLGNQLGHIGRIGIGVQQRRMRHKTAASRAARARLRQRGYAAEHAVVFGRDVAQHHAQCGLVKVLHVVSRNAHAHRTRPIGYLGQLGTQVRQDVLRMRCVMVGDVEQPKVRRICIFGQGHVRAQLRQHQACGHLPLRVGGVTVGKKFHRLDFAAVLRVAVLRAGVLLAAGLRAATLRAAGFRAAALGAAFLAAGFWLGAAPWGFACALTCASARCAMSFMACVAMC